MFNITNANYTTMENDNMVVIFVIVEDVEEIYFKSSQ